MTIKRTRRSTGGSTPIEKSSLGRSLFVRPGRSPGTEASTGTTLAVRPGRSPGEDAAKGYTLAAKRKSGGKLWIKDAIKHPGSLHKSLHVPKGQKIPIAKINKAEHSSNPTLRKKAKLAETLKGFHRPRGR